MDDETLNTLLSSIEDLKKDNQALHEQLDAQDKQIKSTQQLNRALLNREKSSTPDPTDEDRERKRRLEEIDKIIKGEIRCH